MTDTPVVEPAPEESVVEAPVDPGPYQAVEPEIAPDADPAPEADPGPGTQGVPPYTLPAESDPAIDTTDREYPAPGASPSV